MQKVSLILVCDTELLKPLELPGDGSVLYSSEFLGGLLGGPGWGLVTGKTKP